MEKHGQWVLENTGERRRLAFLAGRLGPEELGLELPNGWTVAVVLAHLAFWDLRQASLIRRWVEEGTRPESLDADSVNEPLAQLCAALPPEAALALALDAAEAADLQVERLTAAQAEALVGMGLERNLRRSLHRRTHLDQIEKALGARP
ncbi:MAG TPA: maleylpyruvate isomerase N-terminal domain-containing protein [bacterium]|nr:maleylpyruvate isomerase N-terminal domain-containing protein [bacterium]